MENNLKNMTERVGGKATLEAGSLWWGLAFIE